MRIAVIGAGVNGICSAIALAERGGIVTVFDRSVPFSETSSRSSKLLHGGIRYLEKGHIRLVREALIDRAWWVDSAKQYTTTSRFFIPVYKNGCRSRLKLYAGVKLYEYLAGNYSLGPSRYHNKEETLFFNPLLNPDDLLGSVSYLDVQMDDVALSDWLMRKARSLNVEVIDNTLVERITPEGLVQLCDNEIKRFDRVVNACGPWASRLLSDSKIQSQHRLVLVKGSHLIIDRKIDYPLVIQVAIDGRIIFMLPLTDRALIGTTESVHDIDEKIFCNQSEVEYLLKSINEVVKNKIEPDEIVGSFAGVRPIMSKANVVGDVSSARRNSCIERINNIVNVFGGKWTSGMRLGQTVAEEVFSK